MTYGSVVEQRHGKVSRPDWRVATWKVDTWEGWKPRTSGTSVESNHGPWSCQAGIRDREPSANTTTGTYSEDECRKCQMWDMEKV
ncbi:hypothetical protein OUZ56_015502 [Daphnia magna]|uniref:Uncharacterized protein n=1 Tax=Daphnia magna TaxID=35525 RepID=A0ABR0ANH6_9CRUS|nr:hypothetical protein OUZ56_015502 [Daphnia magna]